MSGRPAHVPTPELRQQVETMSAYGIPEADIGRVIGISLPTLHKHYCNELDIGHVKANAQVAGFLFNAAKKGNVTAQIFWLKVRAGWSEFGAAAAPPLGKKYMQAELAQTAGSGTAWANDLKFEDRAN